MRGITDAEELTRGGNLDEEKREIFHPWGKKLRAPFGNVQTKRGKKEKSIPHMFCIKK